MEARVAVLEHIARETSETLKDIRTEIRDMRKDMNLEFKAVRQEGLKVALWLLGAGAAAFAILFGFLARGFHWIG